jgi:hypothetical protein
MRPTAERSAGSAEGQLPPPLVPALCTGSACHLPPCGIVRSASILLAILAGIARQVESRSALAIAARMAALRMYSVLSARQTRTRGAGEGASCASLAFLSPHPPGCRLAAGRLRPAGEGIWPPDGIIQGRKRDVTSSGSSCPAKRVPCSGGDKRQDSRPLGFEDDERRPRRRSSDLAQAAYSRNSCPLPRLRRLTPPGGRL